MIENPDIENIRLISIEKFDNYTIHFSNLKDGFKLYTLLILNTSKIRSLILLFLNFMFLLRFCLLANQESFKEMILVGILTIFIALYFIIKHATYEIKVDVIKNMIYYNKKYWSEKHFNFKTKLKFSNVKKFDFEKIEKNKSQLVRIFIHIDKSKPLFIDLHESQNYKSFIKSLENIILKNSYKTNIVYQTK